MKNLKFHTFYYQSADVSNVLWQLLCKLELVSVFANSFYCFCVSLDTNEEYFVLDIQNLSYHY